MFVYLGPKLPVNISSHCSLKNKENGLVYIIGGQKNGKTSGNTWMLDLNNLTIAKEGPELQFPRKLHGDID